MEKVPRKLKKSGPPAVKSKRRRPASVKKAAAFTARPATPAPRRSSAWDIIYKIVRKIPRGRVMTYGQISETIGRRLSAQAVGWALHGCPDDVPWQRVVNAAGACSTDAIGRLPPGFQRKLLEKEGVRFDGTGRLALEKYRWKPRTL